jgi:thiol-disulfide isomerase/thioredoxin
MKYLHLLFSIQLALLAQLAFAQNVERAPQGNDSEFGSFEMENDVWEKLGEAARDDEAQVRSHPDAEVVPAGWVDDFDYNSPFPQYLASRVAQAAQGGRKIHLYLYADWLEPCREFRKSVAREDYSELFNGHEVVMIDYGYFAKTFGMQFKNLPVLIQVHEDGKIGPENVHPLSRRAEHPAKAFHRVKSYLQHES